MNWIQALYQTYENCISCVGDFKEEHPLMPLSHTTQNAHIEVTLDESANFRHARVLIKAEQSTIVPCTEKSGGRSGKKPATHPLCDKLQYLAGDFLDYKGTVTSGYANNPTEPHDNYIQLLSDWDKSVYANAKVHIVLTYLKKATLIRDLVESSIIPLKKDEKAFLNEWVDKEVDPPGIFKALQPNSTPQEAFIRWSIEVPADPESRLWLDPAVWDSWNNYYQSTQPSSGLCYVTGQEKTLAIQHPAKLRHAADKAKLISSNDSSGFTFRGRFTDENGEQVCSVSFDVTQKAHNALRWLIARQGYRFGDQAIVAWAISGREIPQIAEASDDLLGDYDLINNDNDPDAKLTVAAVAQDYALKLKKKISGYHETLGNADTILVLALDSATTGRMSITYYREIAASEFLERIEKWHNGTSWLQNLGKNKETGRIRKFIGAPAPYDIALCAYGTRLDDKLKSATHKRLLPCIVEGQPIPKDLVRSCINRVICRQGMEYWEWERSLGIACALYRKQQTDYNLYQHKFTMSLERERNTRSYLYGRLLAVADLLEQASLRSANENRDTNAARFMQRFAERPYSTWKTIYLSLDPHRRRLLINAPGLLHLYDKELDEINNLFTADLFEEDTKLEGEFLLAYHCQRTALWTEQPKEEN